MDTKKVILDKLSGAQHMLLYKERQMLNDGEIEPVLDVVKKRARLLKRISVWILTGVVFSFGYLALFTQFEAGYSVYLQFIILIAMFAFSFRQGKQIEQVVQESQKILEANQ